MSFIFPNQIEKIKKNLIEQEKKLRQVASLYADAIEKGGVIHIYANGHSRITVEESCVRMGALTGFHPLLSVGLTTFMDVIGPNGIRVNQAIEFAEGLGQKMLDEIHVAPNDVLLVVTATGTTAAAVDMALAWCENYPNNPLIGLCCIEQSMSASPKHSVGKNLVEIVESHAKGVVINNGMPSGDLSISYTGKTGDYNICPLSSIGALSVTHALNELTLKELDRRDYAHMVLRNMHLGGYGVNYDEWILDQRKRYSRVVYNPEVVAKKENSNE
ncbi:TPA: SIS domain-containing protein [Aeromonas veronii]|nr:SIS domain-containing protein [Aeromonas veronii]HDO1327350.1 SIS domain-containing protein [Aeromonas veronii]HDO1377071.1 SIS domain-containing protein [Aeromonas veronii]